MNTPSYLSYSEILLIQCSLQFLFKFDRLLWNNYACLCERFLDLNQTWGSLRNVNYVMGWGGWGGGGGLLEVNIYL